MNYNDVIKDKMDWSNKYEYKGKKIYICHETNEYIICSFNTDLTGRFKLSKTEFNK